MRTVDEVINNLDTYKGKTIWSKDEVEHLMKEYAKEVIDEILTDTSLIHIDGDEAVYCYEAFDAFKKSLK